MPFQVVDLERMYDVVKYREQARCPAIFTAFRLLRNSRTVCSHGVRSLSKRALSLAPIATVTSAS